MTLFRLHKATKKEREAARRRANRRRARRNTRNDNLAARDMQQALDRLEPAVARAFSETVQRLPAPRRSDLTEALEARDDTRVAELLGVESFGTRLQGSGLEPGELSFVETIRRSYTEGGTAAARQLRGRAPELVTSLDLTNPAAQRFLGEYVPTMITGVERETQEAVRQIIERGFAEGRPAVKMAREIREIVGLTPQSARAVANFRRQLETGELLGTGKLPWTRRLSAAEQARARRLFEADTAPASAVDALVDRYAESLRNRRAKDIARTETHRAFIEGQHSLWEQATEEGLLDPAETRRIWIVTADDRLREEHAAVPLLNPDGVGLNEPFRTPVGPIMNPGDGPPSFSVNCRCATGLFFLDEPLSYDEGRRSYRRGEAA